MSREVERRIRSPPQSQCEDAISGVTSISAVSAAQALDAFQRQNDFIEREKGQLQHYESVEIVHWTLKFSVGSIERDYAQNLEHRVLMHMIPPAAALTVYSFYSLFIVDFKWVNFIAHWDNAAVVLYNVTWICFVISGIATFTFSLSKPSWLYGHVERYFQLWASFTIIWGMLFGNRWRVSRICDVPYSEAFPGPTVYDMYPDVDLLLLLSACIIYLSLNTRLRFRVLLGPVIFTGLVYSATAIGFGIPEPNSEMKPDRWHGLLLSLGICGIFTLALLGKHQLELFQRRNFLDLEISKRRVNLLSTTIKAADTSFPDGADMRSAQEKTHDRLRMVSRLLQKAKLQGALRRQGGNEQLVLDLDEALTELRRAEKAMTVADFQRQVLLAPIQYGSQYRKDDVNNWISDMMKTGPQSSQSRSKSSWSKEKRANSRLLSTGSALDALGHSQSFAAPKFAGQSLLGDEIGLSAQSLVKDIGCDWELDIVCLEDTLRESGSADIPALQLVGRVLLENLMRPVLQVEPHILQNFLRGIDGLYLDNEYHNSHHGAQVAHQAALLIDTTGVRREVPKQELIAFITAALCHDVGHFGRNNSFLIAAEHEFAIRYNDLAVLENYHAATTFFAMKSGVDADILGGVSLTERRRIRSLIIQLILSTDNCLHFQQVADLRLRMSAHSDDDTDSDRKEGSFFEDDSLAAADRKIAMVSLLRAADIGHTALPWDVHCRWTSLLVTEMIQQGDNERDLGLPISPLCDRHSINVPSMQIGFLDLCVMPLYDQLYALTQRRNPRSVDVMGEICEQLIENRANWQDFRLQGRDPVMGDSHPEASLSPKSKSLRSHSQSIESEEAAWVPDPLRAASPARSARVSIVVRSSPRRSLGGRGEEVTIVTHTDLVPGDKTYIDLQKQLGQRFVGLSNSRSDSEDEDGGRDKPRGSVSRRRKSVASGKSKNSGRSRREKEESKGPHLMPSPEVAENEGSVAREGVRITRVDSDSFGEEIRFSQLYPDSGPQEPHKSWAKGGGEKRSHPNDKVGVMHGLREDSASSGDQLTYSMAHG